MADHITFDIAVRDRLNSALDKAGKKVTHLDKKFDKLGDQLPSKMDKFGKKTNRAMSKSGKAMHGMFDGLESRMGGLSSMAPMLSNPYVAAGAAVAAVTAGAAIGLGKATIAAGNFNHVFLELANLNLDKPNSEIQRLKDNVLDMSLDTGKSAAVISQAYFDVQSATGMYGREVDQVVKKVAVFSKATKTDMNTAIAGAVKGIKNYGLGVNELDAYLESSFKTVQKGIVTFDQLARVQTDYAGAANTAGQSVDSSNKLFAAFTAKQKSAEEAATLTKSALTDLLKPSTLKSFDKVGIQVFDRQTGKVKQLGRIMEEMNEKFKPLRGNDEALNAVVSQFKGSEGLVAMIGEVARNGDDMIKTFREFDNMDVDMSKAAANANKDFVTLSETVKNRLNTSMIMLGEGLLPTVVDELGKFNDALPELLGQTKMWGKGIGQVAGWYWKIFKWASGIKKVQMGLNFHNKLVDKGKQIFGTGKHKDLGGSLFDNVRDTSKSMVLDSITKSQKKEEKPQSTTDILKGAGFENLKVPGKGKGKGNNENTMSDRVRGITSGQSRVRNVIVNIAKQVGIENMNTTNIKESTQDLERIITETVVRSIRSAEVASSD